MYKMLRSMYIVNTINLFVLIVSVNFYYKAIVLQIKMENLNAYCSCAGNFTTVIPRNDMMSYLKTFKAIADYYDMTLLQQILKQYLD